MSKFIFLLALIFSSSSFGACYVISEFKGHATRKNDNYEFFKDGMSKQKFMIEINGDSSTVTPSDIQCAEIGFNTLMCGSVTNDQSSMELWTVYPDDGKAILAKTRTGLGAFNGGFIFVGNIVGSCGK